MKRICSEGSTSWKSAAVTVEPTVVVRYLMEAEEAEEAEEAA